MNSDTERKENDLPSDLQISLQNKSVTFHHVLSDGPGEEKCGRIRDDSFDTMPVHRHYPSYPTSWCLHRCVWAGKRPLPRAAILNSTHSDPRLAANARTDDRANENQCLKNVQ